MLRQEPPQGRSTPAAISAQRDLRPLIITHFTGSHCNIGCRAGFLVNSSPPYAPLTHPPSAHCHMDRREATTTTTTNITTTQTAASQMI